ncbi:MAG: DUF523 domain-containing protein [Candidatus Marinimicrobia bacterium]|nr:DUF523 domain-containing protein [Candidatus Neomarinimicrobiota bacterium]
MNPKSTLIISSCLLGIPCRYDGKHNALSEENIKKIAEKFVVIPVCPEQLGTLPTPRIPAEIQLDGRIVNAEGEDVSDHFYAGAEAAYRIAEINHCRCALMKADSPSCGNKEVYNGSFKDILVPGKGITVKLFEKHQIKVYNETEIETLIGENLHV